MEHSHLSSMNLSQCSGLILCLACARFHRIACLLKSEAWFALALLGPLCRDQHVHETNSHRLSSKSGTLPLQHWTRPTCCVQGAEARLADTIHKSSEQGPHKSARSRPQLPLDAGGGSVTEPASPEAAELDPASPQRPLTAGTPDATQRSASIPALTPIRSGAGADSAESDSDAEALATAASMREVMLRHDSSAGLSAAAGNSTPRAGTAAMAGGDAGALRGAQADRREPGLRTASVTEEASDDVSSDDPDRCLAHDAFMLGHVDPCLGGCIV